MGKFPLRKLFVRITFPFPWLESSDKTTSNRKFRIVNHSKIYSYLSKLTTEKFPFKLGLGRILFLAGYRISGIINRRIFDIRIVSISGIRPDIENGKLPDIRR